ncbi:hypothetical protein [Brenneria izbisi]|uniref:Uncharacterized protein n=1 Tax=Brenneria izbisi TaxID=2939450 RepID=A0AA41XYP3_9GAMM|nr:hypothetical protein [Brenneria izbisi]MCV9879251.1 hypothetical protein [Brenneria izbisi]MCV9882715.1 hypothetical protein [Brenneria izbisi]
MDHDTLVNHIRGLSKNFFDVACKIVLKDYFKINAINVDGANDGGADFISVSNDGIRNNTIYQLTTQKDKIPQKLGRDVLKAIEKLSAKRFYFFTTNNVSEVECRKYERKYNDELEIQVSFFSARHIAEFLLDGNLLNKFLDQTNYPLPRSFQSNPDYKEMALHSYTVMSNEAKGMRDGVYDDTILFILSDSTNLHEDELVEEVIRFLNIESDKDLYLRKRIGALFSKSLLQRTDEGLIVLSQESSQDIEARKRIYEKELSDLAAVQIDIMREDFQVNWTLEESKEISIYIADSYISNQLDLLSDVKAKISIESFFNHRNRDRNSIRDYIKNKSGLTNKKANEAALAILESASNHPLIIKLARASIYVALEGKNAITSAKALGASRWSDFKILVEPTVAIHWICSFLYNGDVDGFYNISKKAIRRALKLDAIPFIPFYYINECASHLLKARKYAFLQGYENPEELQYSKNAFIANYYALKIQGIKVPDNIFDYLKTFSSAVLIERNSWKDWVRVVMTDIQSILNKSGVQFIDTPFYQNGDCVQFEREYNIHLESRNQTKSPYLMDHDLWALQFTHNEITDLNAHWIILTFDNAMIKVSKEARHSGWVVSPYKFLDITASSQSLSDTQYFSLVHSLAVSSTKTLSIGARIIDRVISYASEQFQNWEFKRDFETFKSNLISELDDNDVSFEDEDSELNKKVDEFLRTKGIVIHNEEDSE